MKAAILYDFDTHRHPLTVALAKVSGWDVEELSIKFPQKSNIVIKVYWHILGLLIPLFFLTKIHRYQRVFVWQQDLGIALGLFIHLFRLKVKPDIVVMNFIATSKRRAGLIRSMIEFSLNCRQIKKVISSNPDEVALYKQVFPLVASKFQFVRFAEEIPNLADISTGNDGYFVAAGRSNRDYDFLIEYFSAHLDKMLYIISDAMDKKSETVNIKIFDNVYRSDYFNMLSKSYAVLIAFKDNTVSSGQLVFLHALHLGKPVIATQSSCLKGYISNGVNGMEIEKTQAALDLAINDLNNPEVYAAISARGLQDCQDKFSVTDMGRNVFEISENLSTRQR